MTTRSIIDVEALADLIADRLEQRLRTGAGWIDQQSSPLGSRRHRACVRRRVQAGETGAAIVGRRFLLSAAALAEELARVSRTDPAPEESASDAADRVRRRLRLVSRGND